MHGALHPTITEFRAATPTSRTMTSTTRGALPAQVTAMLLDLMQGSGSDAARIAAAKLLLDHMTTKKNTDAPSRRAAVARTAAIKEAEALLARFALARAGGAERPAALAAQRAAGAIDAPALAGRAKSESKKRAR